MVVPTEKEHRIPKGGLKRDDHTDLTQIQCFLLLVVERRGNDYFALSCLVLESKALILHGQLPLREVKTGREEKWENWLLRDNLFNRAITEYLRNSRKMV